MQQASDLLPQVQKLHAPIPAGQKTSTPSTTSSDIDLINRLFKRLQAIFTKWREVWPTDAEVAAAKRQWMRELVQRRVTDWELIKTGLRKASATGWVRPPSAGQFADWCIEYAMEQAGIPTLEETLTAIDRKLRGFHQPMEGALYQVKRYLNWFELKASDTQTVGYRVKAAHKRMVDHWLSGAPWDEPAPALESPDNKPRGPLTPELKAKAASVFASLRAGSGEANPKSDSGRPDESLTAPDEEA